MSAELDDVYNGLFSGTTPNLWMSKGYPSLCPIGSWFDDLLQRLEFLQVRFQSHSREFWNLHLIARVLTDMV